MYWRPLEYMMDNDPDKTLTKTASAIRKKYRSLFIKVLGLSNKLKLTVEKDTLNREKLPKDRPVIYVACHGFKDDVLNTILTVNDKESYIVFGNIDLFYHTFDGLGLWIYGSQLVNRYDRESKNAMKKKMEKMIDLGNNIIIFSEATWNLSPNELIGGLHGGFYDVAIKKNAIIVPVLTHKVGKKCYSRILDYVDPKELTLEDTQYIELLMNNYINKAIDLNIYKEHSFINIKDSLNGILKQISELKQITDLDNRIHIINNILNNANNIVDQFDKKDFDDDLLQDAYNLIIKYIKRISIIKKEVMSKKIRDILATEKYEMIEEHPDYSYMKDGVDMYEAWDMYLDDTIKGTPYFYPEPEKTTSFRDPLVNNIDEVMPWLSKDKQLTIKR